MRNEIMQFIKQNEEWHQFIRKQPIWYRKLSRDPKAFEQFQISSLHFHQKTIPHKIESFSNRLQFASFMLGMLQSMNKSE